MTARNLKSAIWLVLAVSAAALAAGTPGGGGGGGGGGGNKPPTEAGFNLSVPAIMAGGTGKFASELSVRRILGADGARARTRCSTRRPAP